MDNPICKIICHDGKKIFVDKRLIVKRLEGAYAWLRFLEIEKSGFMASDKDADDCLTFCQEFEITSDEMIQLIHFLRTGLLSTNEDVLSRLMVVINTLGGIPEFDKAYEEIIRIQEHKKEFEKKYEEVTYNPVTPAEDIFKRYIWQLGRNNPVRFHTDEWTVCNSTERVYFYYRKKRVIDIEEDT